MDYMARMVWDNNDEVKETNGETAETDEKKDSEKDESWEERQDQFSHPTILSNADEQATMSAKVDRDAEEMIKTAVREAKERIEKRVESTKTMEMELWLGQSVSNSLSRSLPHLIRY